MPARETPISLKLEMAAAQLMLDLLLVLRRFCAAATQDGAQGFAVPQPRHPKFSGTVPAPKIHTDQIVDYVFWKPSFLQLISDNYLNQRLTLSDCKVTNEA